MPKTYTDNIFNIKNLNFDDSTNPDDLRDASETIERFFASWQDDAREFHEDEISRIKILNQIFKNTGCSRVADEFRNNDHSVLASPRACPWVVQQLQIN